MDGELQGELPAELVGEAEGDERTDRKLLAYFQAEGPQLREELLERLMLEEAAPVVRRIMRYRLHFYLSELGQNASNPDAEDLYHDILLRLVRALQRFSTQPTPPLIRDFRHYTSRVTANGCNDYLRRKYPQRTRLKDLVREATLRHPKLAIWSSSGKNQGSQVGGQMDGDRGGPGHLGATGETGESEQTGPSRHDGEGRVTVGSRGTRGRRGRGACRGDGADGKEGKEGRGGRGDGEGRVDGGGGKGGRDAGAEDTLGQLCGLRVWQDRLPGTREWTQCQYLLGGVPGDSDPDQSRAREQLVDAGRALALTPRGGILGPYLHQILLFLGGPVEIDRLVGLVAFLLGVREPQFEPLPEEPDRATLPLTFAEAEGISRTSGPASRGTGMMGMGGTGGDGARDGARGGEEWGPTCGREWTSELGKEPLSGPCHPGSGGEGTTRPQHRGDWVESLEEKIALDRLWSAVLTLPLRQRQTFFFSFSTPEGEDLLTLLVEGAVAGPSQTAASLGLSLEELLEIWKRMPLRNLELAKMWGVERQQVNKWRYLAIRRLEKLLLSPTGRTRSPG